MAEPSRFAAGAGAGLVLAMLAANCSPGGGPTTARARGVIAELAAENPEYERYVLSIARESASPSARERVVAAIGSPNLATALAAVDALGDAPPAEARDPLRQAFESKGGALKRQAAIQLARLGDAQALEHLKSLTADAAQSLSVPAVLVLARAPGGEEFLTPLLRGRLSSEDAGARGEAYAALGEIREAWATRLLVEGLRAERGELRQPAIVALGRTGDPSVAPEIIPFVNSRGLVFASLEALGALGNPEAADAVQGMAASEEASVRAYAAVALWALGRKDTALEIVDDLMRTQDPTVRSILAERLGSIDDPEAWSRLATLAEDPGKEVRVEAVRALARQARPELEQPLLDAARDPDYEVSTLALTALGRIGRAESLEAVAPLLDADNPYVALSAAQAVLDIQSRAPAS